MHLQEFKELQKRVYGLDLSDEEARDSATRLLLLVKNTYRPLTQSELDDETCKLTKPKGERHAQERL